MTLSFRENFGTVFFFVRSQDENIVSPEILSASYCAFLVAIFVLFFFVLKRHDTAYCNTEVCTVFVSTAIVNIVLNT